MLHFELVAAIVLVIFALSFVFSAVLPNVLSASMMEQLNQIFFWKK